MNGEMKISDQVTISGQPSAEELRRMAEDKSARSIVNLRTAGEPDQPLSPEEEGLLALDLGLQYLHIPVSMQNLQNTQVSQFVEAMQHLPRPVLVHCKSGGRAGLFALIDMGVEQGLTGEATLLKAAEMGITISQPEQREFVRATVDRLR